MIWPFSWFERRSQSWRLSQLQSLSEMGLGGGETTAGVEVTPERALSVPAVFACISVLSQDVAKTPIKLRRRIGADVFEDAVDHPLWEILHDLANPEETTYSVKHAMQFDLLLSGHAYAEIVRDDGGRVVSLWRIEPDRVFVDRDDQRRKRYRVTLANGQQQTFLFDASRPPILELSHPSPLRYCRELIGTALATQAYVGRFFGSGARPGGVLQTDGMLSNESAQRLKESFESYHQGRNQHRVAVLEQGLKYTPIAAANDSSQLNETQAYLRTEIAGMFRVAPFKIGDLSRANYSNVEALAIEHATGTLDPFFSCWESAIRRDLLTTRQFGAFDVQFDRASLIRSDIKSLHDALARGRDAGIYSVNDARRALGMNPIPAASGGDLYQANGNLRPLIELGQPQEGA